MRIRILCCLLLSIHLCTHAQIPQPGIYRVDKDNANHLNARHYLRNIHNIRDFFTVNLAPHNTFLTYNLSYALLAVNRQKGYVRLALLRDTVTQTGKALLSALQAHPDVYYPEEGRPYFAQVFTIEKDSLMPYTGFDAYFPDRPDLDGEWLCRPLYDTDAYLTCARYPRIAEASRYDSSLKKYLYGHHYTFEQSTLLPAGSRPYTDLRYTYRLDNIPIYASPGKSSVIGRFRKNEYIAVLKDTLDQWLQVERVIVQPDTKRYLYSTANTLQSNTRLDILRGWIKQEDLAASWIKQKAKTPLFRFHVSGVYQEGEGALHAIRITHQRTGRKQLILDIGAAVKGPLDETIITRDCNFDGYPDIMLYFANGGAGPNYSYNFYLYNPATGLFDYNAALSGLSQVEVDEKKKVISSAWRSGAAGHGAARYTFINGKLTQVSYWEEYWKSDGYFETATGKLENGRWIEEHLYGGLPVKGAKLYAQADDTTSPITTLDENAVLTVKKETPLWYYVQGEDTSGRTYSGWIRKADLPLQH
jgi:hypothetical protein